MIDFVVSFYLCSILYYTPKLCIESSVVVLFTYLDNDVEQVLRLFSLHVYAFSFLNGHTQM